MMNQTQYGCASSAFISTAVRTHVSGTTALTAPKPADNTVTATTTSTAYIFTRLPESSRSSGSLDIGAIVGGAVGGFAALSATGFGMFFALRKLKKENTNHDCSAMTGMPHNGKPDGGGVV